MAGTGIIGGGNIEPRALEDEMRSAYLDYAMSVIVGRALPDVRDGLKPVHRIGKTGIEVKRFKGLGEMNAEQLWETTLDPEVRTLLQVKVREADEADDLFGRLMGDEVDPRREFIQDNALSVANLDV